MSAAAVLHRPVWLLDDESGTFITQLGTDPTQARRRAQIIANAIGEPVALYHDSGCGLTIAGWHNDYELIRPERK